MIDAYVLVTADDVVKFTGQGDDSELLALAEVHLPIVVAYVRAYTRGNGFNGPLTTEDLKAVILTATARLIANPLQHKREELTGYSVTPTPFAGFTVAETLVMNAYRVRTR